METTTTQQQPPWASELVARNRKVARNMGIWSSTESYFEPETEGLGTTSNKSSVGKVVDPVGVPSSSASYRRTEKSTPIREETVEDSRKEMREKSGEESFLEYGPGIVRKLMSRYQSLALRQSNLRPSLRRSASLENCLDSVGTEPLEAESPSPVPLDENERRTYKSSMTMNMRSATRGRTTSSDNVNRRDRMRRARSVDALHTRSRHEEEILEKFRTVVLPKEEIVIIEVSKPKSNNISSSVSSNLLNDDKVNPPQLFIIPTSLSLNEQQQQQYQQQRKRSLTSPEHELPPPDIVRETARIFEKNQENLPVSKKVGHALRLSKTSNSSVSPSPPSTPTPTSTPTNSLQRNHVMAQGSPSMQAVKEKEKSPSPSFPTSTNKISNSVSHGPKQVGIIRPTVSNSIPVTLNGERGPSPALSPIAVTNKPLHFFRKPPLSPKPIFTSSPKSTYNSNTSNKIGSNDSPDSPEPRNDLKQVNNNRVKLPLSPPPVQNRRLILNGTSSNNKNISSSVNSGSSLKTESTDTTEKEPFKVNQVSISLRPVPNKSSESRNPPNGIIGTTTTPSEPKTVLKKSHEVNFKHEPREAVGKNEKGNVTVVAPNKSKEENQQNKIPSQLRNHQKQKLAQSGNGSMVFNFTNRQKVPDYIEDDGLRRKITLDGTVTDESHDEVDSSSETDRVDPRLILFEGANVIINGRSSIQKKPKSQKLNISFNEDATTTFEYPSEASILGDEEVDKDNLLGQKTCNVINNSGSGLGSYTPSKMSNLYQLNTYSERNGETKNKSDTPLGKKDENSELIEDYLKPDTETTTWSNEIGADILF